jgi:hypothetical protein
MAAAPLRLWPEGPPRLITGRACSSLHLDQRNAPSPACIDAQLISPGRE